MDRTIWCLLEEEREVDNAPDVGHGRFVPPAVCSRLNGEVAVRQNSNYIPDT